MHNTDVCEGQFHIFVVFSKAVAVEKDHTEGRFSFLGKLRTKSSITKTMTWHDVPC